MAQLFKRQYDKMVKHTQTISRQIHDHFVGLALKGLTMHLFWAYVSVYLIYGWPERLKLIWQLFTQHFRCRYLRFFKENFLVTSIISLNAKVIMR